MLNVKRTLLGALPIAIGATLTTSAQAQQPLFYLDRIQISGAPDDGFAVWRPYLHEKTRFYGTAALGFTYNPLRADTVTRDGGIADTIDDPVQGQFIGYLIAGTEVSHRFGFNVAMPISLYTIYGDNLGGLSDFNAGRKMALHDLRLDARVRVFETDSRKSRYGLGGAVFAPTGDSAGALAGDSGTTAYFYGSAEFDLGDFFIAANVGPHFRPNHGIRDITTGQDYSMPVGSELRWALGGYVPLRNDRIRLGLELFGNTGIMSVDGHDTVLTGQNTNLEWLAQARMKLDKAGHLQGMGGLGTRLASGYGAPDLRVLVSLGYWFTVSDTRTNTPPPRYKHIASDADYEKDRDGDGYPDDIDKCPDIKEDGKKPNPSDGCPADADRDGDGIPDAQDACPDVPEDKDGVADSDGCPEDDADSDGIPDGQDKCPTEKGSASKVAERNGCPSIRFTGEDEIQLLEPIQFETGKAIIKPESYHILDEVVELLKSRKDLRIGVYGHTDSVGSDESNLVLSRNRAASCMKYLIDHGISDRRLESNGFGEGEPVDTNETPQGRARNRRTEFKVLN